MRKDIYNGYDNWNRDPGMEPEEWIPGETPIPYGEVQGEPPTVPQGRRTPDFWKGRKEKGSRRSRKVRPREENGTGGF